MTRYNFVIPQRKESRKNVDKTMSLNELTFIANISDT